MHIAGAGGTGTVTRRLPDSSTPAIVCFYFPLLLCFAFNPIVWQLRSPALLDFAVTLPVVDMSMPSHRVDKMIDRTNVKQKSGSHHPLHRRCTKKRIVLPRLLLCSEIILSCPWPKLNVGDIIPWPWDTSPCSGIKATVRGEWDSSVQHAEYAPIIDSSEGIDF